MITLIFWFIVIAFAIAIGVYALAIGGLVFAGWNYFQNKKWLETDPTPMVCPNCGNTNVQFQNVTASANTVSYGRRMRAGKTKFENRHVATCQSCGHTFEYVTALDIQDMIRKTRTNIYIGLGASGVGILFIIFSALSGGH